MAEFDVIIVLGAAVWKGNRPSPALRRRLSRGVALWKEGTADYLLVTGGLGEYPPAEARMMETLAIREGVPPERIIPEGQSASTLESGIHCAGIMEERAWSKAMVVTDGYHLPRSLLVFRSLGIDAEGNAADAGTPVSPRQWFPLLREAMALLWYLLRISTMKLQKRI